MRRTEEYARRAQVLTDPRIDVTFPGDGFLKIRTKTVVLPDGNSTAARDLRSAFIHHEERVGRQESPQRIDRRLRLLADAARHCGFVQDSQSLDSLSRILITLQQRIERILDRDDVALGARFGHVIVVAVCHEHDRKQSAQRDQKKRRKP